MSFLKTQNPQGFGGKIMLIMMNSSHSAMAGWRMKHVRFTRNSAILDIGCGGASIKKVLANMGFADIGVDKNEKGWLCVMARKG